MVGIANILDIYVVGTGERFENGSHFLLYISNEGISFWDQKVLEQLHDRSEEDKDNGEG